MVKSIFRLFYSHPQAAPVAYRSALKSIGVVSILLIAGCSSSGPEPADDDDDAALLPPPDSMTDGGDNDAPDSVDGTWRTACLFIPGSFIGTQQIRTYVRQGSDTAYVIDYFSDTNCTQSTNRRLLMRGTTESIGEVMDSVFGVNATAVRFSTTQFSLGGNPSDLEVEPFEDIVYVGSDSRLLLGDSETNDSVSGIPQALDWNVLYTYQGLPDFPTQ